VPIERRHCLARGAIVSPSRAPRQEVPSLQQCSTPAQRKPPLGILGTSCKATETVARLRHSWIKNQIRSMEPADVVALWRQGKWQTLEVQFPFRIGEVLELAEALVPSFSSSTLVPELHPLNGLSDSDQELVRRQIDALLWSTWDASPLRAELLDSAKGMAVTLAQVLEAWSTSPSVPGADNVLRTAWKALSEQADDLLEALDKIPARCLVP
jgi:hypothetical protein